MTDQSPPTTNPVVFTATAILPDAGPVTVRTEGLNVFLKPTLDAAGEVKITYNDLDQLMEVCRQVIQLNGGGVDAA